MRRRGPPDRHAAIIEHVSSPAAPPIAISVQGLRKSYGENEAVRGIDLEVAAGEIFAFLGPNGAGKTTTTEILEGYRERSAGDVTVLGEDPAAADRDWRERIGIVLQQCDLQPLLTVRETLSLYAGYFSGAAPDRRDDPPCGADRAGGFPSRAPVRRTATPARRRRGAGRRPGASVPRRADDRVRSLRAPAGLGGDREPQGARQDGVPDHALHGRGAGARRPGRDHRRGADRRRGPARGARRPPGRRHDDPLQAAGRASGPTRCRPASTPRPAAPTARSR